MNTVRMVEVIKSLHILDLNGDIIFARIKEDIEKGLLKEARQHLNFVDTLIKQLET